MIIYKITGLEKGKTTDGKDKWKAHIKGYYFQELDSDPAEEGYSENGKAVWAELRCLTIWCLIPVKFLKQTPNGSLSLWSTTRRKTFILLTCPAAAIPLTHKRSRRSRRQNYWCSTTIPAVMILLKISPNGGEK
ncbi:MULTISPECIES: hypothetical protein [unclassified Dehalobacter]|uniref:hypothetical protein n=1 Tax=unclassified Dehalobacter TaxID=2635733 RepID=UPI000E6D34D9|nr:MULTISPECIES: hypothetical protein [unclassified Dehalobacter]RJE47182.1 hypothetical protein A7K50_04200 [Dehalobacter sp. MCB1]TCX53655.1 hypothetical protein C1I36_02640 [Dehalobacter sp. 14DCB1]TCX54958.1 hypothetical protein C1I38_04605 [Dehalobacter sp. 12DCB1]